MMRFARNSVGRLAHETRGAEIAEAAAVLPLMFMILLGIFWFGQAFSIYGAITRAAQDGARAGAAPACTTCTPLAVADRAANAERAIQIALDAAKLNSTLARQSSPTLTSCGGGPPPSCDGGSSNFCVQAPVQLSDTATGSGVCGVSVSFQYPFQFYLPFTSLNKQKIWISASARVRLENQ